MNNYWRQIAIFQISSEFSSRGICRQDCYR